MRLVGTAKDICVEFPRLGFDHQPDQHLINARIKLYFGGVMRSVGTAKDICVESHVLGSITNLINTWLMLESSYI